MDNPKERKIIVVLGPTSSGKSDLAVELAKKYNGEVISADSRQIYRYMDLGTGKVEGGWVDQYKKPLNPPLEKGEAGKGRRVYVFEGVTHHLIDFVEPNEDYNISHFKKDCERLIKEITAKGKVPIICGGTGFWIKAVVYDQVLPEVKPNEKLRKELDGKTTEELLEILKDLDLERVGTVDVKNKIRLIRAIEIAKELGKVPKLNDAGEIREIEDVGEKIRGEKENERESGRRSGSGGMRIVGLDKDGERWEFLQLGINFPKEELSERIRKRLDLRFEAGMIEEVRSLKEKHNLAWQRIESFGLAYFWIPKFLKGEINEVQLRERLFLAERQYAKRQMTWFNKDEGINWIGKENKKAMEMARELLG